MKSKLSTKIVKVGVIIVLIIIVLPFIINLVFIKVNIPSATDLNNAEWLNFWGGYLGSATGGLFTLATIFFTILFYEKQQESHEQELQKAQTQNEELRKHKEWSEYMPELEIYYHDDKIYIINRRKMACYDILMNEKKIASQLHSCAEMKIDYPKLNVTLSYEIKVRNVLGEYYKFEYALEKLIYNVPFNNSYIPNGAYAFIMKQVNYTSKPEVKNATKTQ